jgi:hypothetical protein
VRSGIRSARAFSRAAAVGDGAAAWYRFKLGTLLSAMTRSALSGYPPSHAEPAARNLASNSARNPAPSAGMPTSAQNAGSNAAHSAAVSNCSAQSAYACAR